MIPDGDGKSESKMDPEELTQLIELEMAQKRTAWAEAEARHRKIRTMSLALLMIVIIGALIAFFLLFTKLTQERAAPGTRPQPGLTP